MPKHAFALVDDTFRDFRSNFIRVKVAENNWEKQGYFELRKKTFSDEQKILIGNEKDAKDFRAIPIVAVSTNWSVAEDVVGAVRIYQTDEDENTWYGGRLCVARQYRGHKSIGKALINEAVSRAKDLGCTKFFATVQPQNEKYFKSVSWQTIGKLDVAGKPHIHMQANLENYPIMPRSFR